ncbi:MAG: hypothetical protein HQL95_06615 [Magnetococcales bacterium]|nr:hypothetical protein [Magnetococcales bacterium]
MNASFMMPPAPATAALQPERERAAALLFETTPPEITALLAHGPWDPNPPRPAPEELLAPLAAGLKRFQISW